MQGSTKRRVGYTHYSSADAFEQKRLDQYIQRRVSGRSGIGSLPMTGGLPYIGGYGGTPGGGSGVKFASFTSNVADTITDGTSQNPVALNTTYRNANSLASLGSNKATIIVPGFYLILLIFAVDSASDWTNGNIYAQMNKNSGTIQYFKYPTVTGAGIKNTPITLLTGIGLSAGDQIYGVVDNDSGQTLDIVIDYLTLVRLGS